MKQEDIDAAYEIDSKIPDWSEKQARYTALSAALAPSSNTHLDISYGPDARHTMDIFSTSNTGQMAPIIVFFHGGYWKGGSKDSRRFPAPAWNSKGVAWASVEYRLAPAASLDEIVDDVRSAVAWLHNNASTYGCNRDAIHIAGNSAGGHLTGMLLADGWHRDYDLPQDLIKSAAAVSGLYDFDPLLRAYTQDWLGLDDQAAIRNSPLGLPPRPGAKVTTTWGSLESTAFANQSISYAKACEKAGAVVEAFEMSEHDHYSIIGELADPSSRLFQTIARNIGGL